MRNADYRALLRHIRVYETFFEIFSQHLIGRIPITDVAHREEKNGGRKEVLEKASANDVATFDRGLREPIGGTV